MYKTLEKINSLVDLGIIRNYAIGGAMGQLFYIAPTPTYDLDIMVHLNGVSKTDLDPLRKIYQWAEENNYKLEREYIKIEGMPVQFLPAFDDLVSEAIDTTNKVEMFGIETFVMKPEYLMAIMLKTGRNKDKTRLADFLEEFPYNENYLEIILKKHNLLQKFDSFKERKQ